MAVEIQERSNRADNWWKKTGGDDLLKGRSFQEIVDFLFPKEKEDVFTTDRVIRCVDERTPGGKRRAGSGILDPKAVEDFKKNAIEGLTSHENCGAGVLFAQQEGIETSDTDTTAEERIKQIAAEANVPFKGRITSGQMVGPSDGHFARCLYYTLVDFDPNKSNKLPVGFVLSRDIISDPDQAIKEGRVVVSIAFGHHTKFSSLFDGDHPFYLVAVLPDDEPELREQITEELEQIRHENSAAKIDYIVKD